MSCNFQPVERPGLYVMVFLTMLNSCDASDEASKANRELKRIADAVITQAVKP